MYLRNLIGSLWVALLPGLIWANFVSENLFRNSRFPLNSRAPERDDCRQLSNYGMSFHFTVLDTDDAINQALEPARLTLVPAHQSGSTHLSIRAGSFAQDGDFANSFASEKQEIWPDSLEGAAVLQQGTGRFEFAICNRFQQAGSTNATGKACVVPEKAVRVQTNQPVAAAVSQGDESYTLIPDAAAGQEYIVTGWFPPTNPGNAIKQNVLAIVSIMDNTTVTIAFPIDPVAWTCKIGFGMRTYQAGDKIQLDLQKDTSLIVQAQCDLTGALVTATRPFAVFSSINRNRVGTNDGSTSRSVMQLPPTSAWGSQHIAYKTPSTGAPGAEVLVDMWKITAGLRDTQVLMFHSDTQRTETLHIRARSCYSMPLYQEKWVEITSDRPVLVTQVIMASDGMTPQDAIVHTPVEQFKTRMMLPRYLLWPHNLTMIVVRKETQTSMIMNDIPLTVEEWTPQPNVGTQVAALPLSSGLVSSFLRLTSPSAPFAAYVVERFDGNNVRVFSGGTCYDQLVCFVSST